jgi:hypothetical protein
MKGLLLMTLLAVAVFAFLGCESARQSVQETARVQPAGPLPETPRPMRTAGSIYRVWPYGHGELMADLGARDGLRPGDMLLLVRGGKVINTITVLNVQDGNFFGRVDEHDDEALMPQPGDKTVKAEAVHRLESSAQKEEKR